LGTVIVLSLINAWLWTRIGFGIANRGAFDRPDLILTGLASLVTLVLVIALWHNPISRNVLIMNTPALRQSLATHHAGHIVAAHHLDPCRVRRTDLSSPCNHHVSEVPSITQGALRGELSIAVAGLTAEELFAGESGSHSASDLVRATNIAADMVGRFGMAGSLVSLAVSRPRRKKFIAQVLDDPRTRKELESLLREVQRDTTRLVLENRHIIIAVRDALMRHGSLDPGQIHDVIGNAEEVRHTDDEVLVDLRVVNNSRPAVSQI
jgi:hypothetical protein